MRILLTGATGLIGRHLLERLTPEHEVVALARRPPADSGGEVEWVRQDLVEPLDRGALPREIDTVVHLAQSERFRDFPEGAEDVFEVNVHSTQRLLEYARGAGARGFVLASTGGIYASGSEPVTESSPIVAPGPYFRSKLMAELLLDDYAEFFAGLALRFFFVYGPGPGQTLVPRLARRIIDGEEVTVEGEPGMRINPIYAHDAAEAVAAAVGVSEGAAVNIAGAELVSIGELVRLLGAALGREPRIRYTTGEAPADLVADTSRMESLLGVRPSTSLEEGLGAVAASLARL